jgi:hypothetical protein
VSAALAVLLLIVSPGALGDALADEPGAAVPATGTPAVLVQREQELLKQFLTEHGLVRQHLPTNGKHQLMELRGQILMVQLPLRIPLLTQSQTYVCEQL